jgi:hypothetical protein
MADRLEAARWLADRGFGKSLQTVEVALEAEETVDVHPSQRSRRSTCRLQLSTR